MKKNFQTQFNKLRSIIQANVSTLKSLIDQSDSLSEIIRSLGDNPEEESNKQLKEKLESIKRQIATSIQELTTQTERLFDSYNQLIEEVFGEK